MISDLDCLKQENTLEENNQSELLDKIGDVNTNLSEKNEEIA